MGNLCAGEESIESSNEVKIRIRSCCIGEEEFDELGIRGLKKHFTRKSDERIINFFRATLLCCYDRLKMIDVTFDDEEDKFVYRSNNTSNKFKEEVEETKAFLEHSSAAGIVEFVKLSSHFGNKCVKISVCNQSSSERNEAWVVLRNIKYRYDLGIKTVICTLKNQPKDYFVFSMGQKREKFLSKVIDNQKPSIIRSTVKKYVEKNQDASSYFKYMAFKKFGEEEYETLMSLYKEGEHIKGGDRIVDEEVEKDFTLLGVFQLQKI